MRCAKNAGPGVNYPGAEIDDVRNDKAAVLVNNLNSQFADDDLNRAIDSPFVSCCAVALGVDIYSVRSLLCAPVPISHRLHIIKSKDDTLIDRTPIRGIYRSHTSTRYFQLNHNG